MANEQKIFIDFFPMPPEPNPFFFKSWEDYEKAREARDKLGYAEDEREDILFVKKVEIKEADILRWQQLLIAYEKALNEGLQDRFKETEE